jgi:hypothetical protein
MRLGQTVPNAGAGLRARRAAKTMAEKFGTPDQIADSFWALVDVVDDPDSCWLWRSDYGVRRYATFRHTSAHRVAYWIAISADPGDAYVLHTCDTPRCVRPAHLHLGDNAENMQERSARGRFVHKGFAEPKPAPTRPRRKLTPEQVDDIRAEYSTRTISQRALAKKYGIDQGHVSAIVNWLAHAR